MKIVAYGQGSAGAGVAARRWKAGREVTGRGRVGDDRGSREGSPAGRWWTLAAVCLGEQALHGPSLAGRWSASPRSRGRSFPLEPGVGHRGTLAVPAS
jgi:hypothetical protein